MEYDDKLIESLKCQAQRLRRDVVISMGVGVAGHIGGSNSSADIVAALYFCKMKQAGKPRMEGKGQVLIKQGACGNPSICGAGGMRLFPGGGFEAHKGNRLISARTSGCTEDPGNRGGYGFAGAGAFHWTGYGPGSEAG